MYYIYNIVVCFKFSRLFLKLFLLSFPQNVTEDKEPEEIFNNSVSTISDDKKMENDPVLNEDSNKVTQDHEQSSDIEIKTEELKTSSTLISATEEKPEITEPILHIIAVVESQEDLKLNGNGINIESSKNEVKSENDKLTAYFPNSNENSTKSPPPLPMSPQPSQVMEFALNDNNDQQQNIECKSPPTDLNVTPRLQIPSVVETAPTPEIERKEEITPDIVKDIAVKMSEIFIDNVDESISAITEIDQEHGSYRELDVEVIENAKDLATYEKGMSLELICETESTFEEKTEFPNEKIVNPENSLEQEKNINVLKEKEHVAECLVEEITQTAMEVVVKQLNNDLPPPPSSDLENSNSSLNGINGHGHFTETNKNLSMTIQDEHSTHKVNK